MAVFCGWTEIAYVSTCSIMHFLSGYLWCIVWVWAFSDTLPWLNLLLFTASALVFEVLENQKGSGSWMWGWLGYDTETYTGDSALNAVSDVLISIIGWLIVRIVTLFTTSTVALGAMLGAAGVLFLVFLYFFRIERRIVLGSGKLNEPERPPLMLLTAS